MRLFSLFASLGALLVAAGCGGGSSQSLPAAGTQATASVNNVAPIVVNGGPVGNSTNFAFVTVTVCVPGASNCQTIDNIQVDTGSSGLRLINSVVSPALTLPAQTVIGGNLFECLPLRNGSSVWGSVRLATVQIAGETASNIPIQIIGDSNPPNACSPVPGGQMEDDVLLFGANGLLGIGFAIQDCGSACTSTEPGNPGLYYVCGSTTGCLSGAQPAVLPVNTLQVSNPVASFSTDNNGAIVELPSIPPTGAASVSGSLVFGIGTQSNNGLGSAQVFAVDSAGNINTTLNGTPYSGSICSGSSGLYFPDPGTPESNGFYCPSSPQTFIAQNQDQNGVPDSVSFSVGNACALLSPLSGNFAFNNLAGPNFDPTIFEWGLPFFFGRDVYTAIEGRATPAGPGPYFAYKPATEN